MLRSYKVSSLYVKQIKRYIHYSSHPAPLPWFYHPNDNWQWVIQTMKLHSNFLQSLVTSSLSSFFPFYWSLPDSWQYIRNKCNATDTAGSVFFPIQEYKQTHTLLPSFMPHLWLHNLKSNRLLFVWCQRSMQCWGVWFPDRWILFTDSSEKSLDMELAHYKASNEYGATQTYFLALRGNMSSQSHSSRAAREYK